MDNVAQIYHEKGLTYDEVYYQGRVDMRDDVIAIIARHHFDDDKDNMDLMLHNICKEIKLIK